MTKLRAPISIDTALARIAGQVDGGWDAMAEHVDYQARTVRAWGDTDRNEQIPLPAAIALDILFQSHGGTGAPLFEAHGDMVRIAAAEAFGDKHDLRREAIDFMRETNEANLALLEAAEPDAGDAAQVIATKQVLDVRQWADKLLTRLGRKPP